MFTAQVGSAAVITRNIIQALKKSGWLNSGLTITLANFLISALVVFVLQITTDTMTGVPITGGLVKSLLAGVFSMLYHDFNDLTNSLNTPPIVTLPAVSPTLPPAA